MTWINKYLTNDEMKKIEETISRVEEETSGEIVPVIVKRSSAIGHVPLVLTLILTLVFVLAEIPYSDWLWVTPWVWMWFPVLIVIYGVSFFLAKLHWFQKVFVSEADEIAQVHQRAQLEFYSNKIHRTEAGTGVLIFVSVMEKKAVILADEAISGKLPPDTWNNLLKDLRASLHDGHWHAAFTKAIETCGQHLKTHFPIAETRKNQLKNHLVVKE
ncbi:TPM domain-containing protein [Bdellovibrio reynosensis]|uniref:TPM domain-containing protein n=1 Tax=Bdellovibrio reynosensis TaxID=2835041 RepID=A0ABY4CCI0_9BACT|nr:TPM domain-containing protein [Bdellovibrio reynosensis]UOF02677.1 TPM domain-containing protein [Bdellovibrio reynosensis]